MAEDLMQAERDVRKKRLPLRRTLMKGAQLGVLAALMMSVLLAGLFLLPEAIRGRVDDDVLEGFQVALVGYPVLTIPLLMIAGAFSALILHAFALYGSMQLRLGLFVGACSGVLWGLLIYAITVGVISNPYTGWASDPVWLTQTASSGALVGCWYGWRMAVYIRHVQGINDTTRDY
jgi:hypothetical protein